MQAHARACGVMKEKAKASESVRGSERAFKDLHGHVSIYETIRGSSTVCKAL